MRAATLMNARDCVALFLLQVQARLRITHSRLGESFELPLTQELIGSAVGLSTVSVNRAIRSLERQKRVRRSGRIIEFLDSKALAREVDFVDRFYRVDASWFPGMD
jgi:CRP-like cAMP-binding protein